MKYLIEHIPVPTAGLALGLAALGILLQPYSEILHIACGVLSFFLVLLLAAKVFLFASVLKSDLQNSIAAGVSATCFMTCMQLSTYIAPVAYGFAFVVWAVSVVAHFGLMILFTRKYILHFELESVFPTHFIAYVGIIVASVTSPTFGMQGLGWIIFWFGFVCYAILLVVVSVRISRHELPEAAQPLFCIYAAPMSLSLAGYLAATPQPQPIFVLILLVLAQFLYVVVLTRLPKLLRLKFYPSFAAMTFPFVITATALTRSLGFLAQSGFVVPTFLQVLVWGETLFAAVMVIFVFVHYLRFFLRTIRQGKQEALSACDSMRQNQ